jgi:acyl carrier protein
VVANPGAPAPGASLRPRGFLTNQPAGEGGDFDLLAAGNHRTNGREQNMSETPQAAPWAGGTEDALRADVAATLRELLKARGRSGVESWTEETTLEETGADSFDVIECIVELEDRYNVSIDFNANDSSEKMDTVSDVINLVVRSVAAAQKP